jgi:hypothetical protein
VSAHGVQPDVLIVLRRGRSQAWRCLRVRIDGAGIDEVASGVEGAEVAWVAATPLLNCPAPKSMEAPKVPYGITLGTEYVPGGWTGTPGVDPAGRHRSATTTGPGR